MSCVNRNSKEFKFLAEHNDLSINALELITHKYWLENKTEDYFPSDVYIQAQLGKIPYEEPTKVVRDLWDLKYKEPQEYTSLEELQEARTEALKYFPEEAITYHKNFKDNYVLVVRKPMTKLSLSISTITGKAPQSSQEQADYDLITKNLIKELGENSTFAKEIKRQQQNNNNINDFINGKKKFNNLSEEENDVARRDQLLAAAGIQARRNEGSSSKESQDERNERQERQVETWAKQNGVWHEDALSYGKSFGEELPGGQESHVYENPKNGTVIKVKNTLQYHDLQEFLDGIILHNTLFPETAYKVLGFGNDGEGFVAILEQPFVRGEEPTQEQITKHIKSIQPDAEMYEQELKNGRYKTSKTLIHDISPKNAIITPAGNIAIIDGIIRPNVASEGKGGNRAEDSSLIDTKTNNLNELQMSVSTPQTFTFKDGTTVRAPFKPNYQQEDALNAMDEFINSNRTSMTLSGFAGTGKTSLMEMLAEKMRKQYKSVMFCASTNKAAAVLKERVSKSGFEAQTLNKVFGITVEVDPNKSYNARNLINKLKDVDIPYGTTVIIDEASMINEENYAILNEIAKKNGLKIIYVGDAAQLAPVNETKISKVFRDQGHEVRTLSIVERTGDNAILKEATDLRDGKALSGKSSFNSKGQGVAYLKPSSTQEREAVIRRFIPELKNNPNYFRILAYTNAAVAAYNTKVRQLLGYNDNIPRVGEPITGYANWGYTWDRNGGSYKFINSEAYKVVAVQQPKTITKDLPKVGKVSLQVIPITLENSLGEKRDYNLIDVKGNQENRATAFRLAKAKAELHNTANKLGGRAQVPYRQAANTIEEFLFVNDTLGEKINGKEVAYQTKVFDFGYAMTVHKSQGSTFTHVLMDDVDIDKAKDERNSDSMGMQDVTINWDDAVSDEPATYDISGPMEDVNMGDWGSETPSTEGTLMQEPPRPQQENTANIRQQLKYVAVSRATDTVTIISNNVKKEDSPLNHIQDVPANSSIGSNPVASPETIEQMSSQEVWRYMSAMQPLTKRSQVEYTPQGQPRQTYTVENGHIYNQKGTEVYPGKTVHKNMILANLAVKEGRAVVITHPTSGEKYVVSNNQQITSVKTGKIMQWGEENGDRRAILEQAETAFRNRIKAIKESGSALTQQLMDYLPLIGIDTHNREEMIQYLKEHGYNSVQEFIGKKARTQFEQSLKKARPDMTDAEIQSTLDFLHSLENNKENTAYIKTAIRWVANHSITLPQDNVKARQAFDLARKKHIDLQKYNTLGELIAAPEMQPKEKEKKAFNPDTAKTFSNKRTVTTEGGRVFTIYDVENTEEGQREVCKALAAHYEMSPWCLSTFTTKGEPTESAKRYWNLYKALPRKIAFENGKPVAFNSDKYGKGIAETLFRGTPIIVQGEEAIIDSTERGRLSRGTIDAWKQEGFITESKIIPNALRLTEKAKKEIYNTTGEAWWDMEDTHPQDSLSDTIVSNPKAIGRGEEAWQAAQEDLENERREHEAELQDLWEQEAEEMLQNNTVPTAQPAVMRDAYGRPMLYAGEGGELPFFLTPQGEVYGFATPKGNLYFDETVISPEHLIHEYTHLWDRVVAKNNPKLWKQGITLMKQISLWQDIENDPNYGQKWKAMKGMTSQKLESLIASEVHARLVGVNGEQILNNISKQKGAEGIIGKLKQWLLDFWKDLKATFSDWSEDDLNKLTLQDFTMMTVRDLADGFNPNAFPTNQDSVSGNTIATQQTSVPASYEGMITPDANTIFVFGSNTEGRHGAGAAKTAREKFGAIYGQGEGLQGNAYALPTKDLRVKENRSLRSISPAQITESIKKMYEVARQNPSKQFKVAYTNGLNEATLNGYTGAEMIKMFKQAGPIPPNVVFNKEWTDHWNEVQASAPEASASAQTNEIPLDTSAIFNNPSSTEVTVEDKMKPWRNDPSKQNISRRIYLKDHKDKGYFEVVKDFEDNYYSVHFKPTDSDNPNAFSKEEKEILFQAVADTLPVGSKLSTWGELSRGGIAGLERFSKLGFAKSGERTVTMKGTGEEVNIPVFTKFPNTTQRISLLGYEYFTDATEDTLVDAPWKIPLLQQLDAQFSNANPEGRNEEILEQMKAILEAESFEDWQNNANSKTKQQVQKNLDEYDKLITQLNNLLDSDVITASEVRHVAELVVNAISDNLTQIQKEKGLAEQQFPTLNSKLDFQTASRKDIIQAIGIDRLIYRAKLLFDPENNEYEDLETLEQADLIIDNWDAIMTLAADIFAANEGVGISKDFSKGNWQSVNGQKIDFDNFNDYKNDPDAMAEETKDEQEHWQIEQRTIDILNSMSAMVRLALHECYQIDKDGNTVISKWGIPERVNARKAVNSILRWTQGSLSLEDMITKLSEKQGQHPWLNQLITRLSDKTGAETDFQSQFYGVFAKHFQLYSVVLLEDGKYHSMVVNSHPALSEAMQTITTQFRVGEHPLFTSNGINKKLLGSENTTSPKTDFNLHKALAELQVLSDRIRHGEEVDAEMAEIASNNIIGVCRVLGYPVADSMVSEIVNSDNILYLTKNLGFIVKDLDAAAKAGKKDYDPFAFKKENSIGGSLRNFLTPITDQLEDTATNAFYDSGKMYQSYVTPSFMTKLLQKFRLEGQDFEDFLEGEYGNSEWFKFKGRNGAWRNEWLRMLATNEDARKVFDHKVELNFNKHSYMRNMTDAEYTLSLFAEYFAESSDDKQSLVPAWFRIPMQSNKPSSEFIKFYSYRGATYKEDIVHGLHSMFLQELSRIQTVNMRNKSKDDPSFIKNFDKNGKQFNFLPFLNSYLNNSTAAKKGRNLLETEAENNELASLLQKRIDTTKKLTPTEESRLDELVDRAIYNHMETRAQEILNRWEQEGILEAAKQVEGVGTEDADVRRAIENYLWNDCFAAKNILQLTVGDIAFYKDAEDLQKRLAQLHAPGIRGNVAATDYQGNRVSDGYYRTFILQDFDTFKSNIIANIAEVFDRKIADAPESQKAQLRALKESLVGKDGKYTKINVTDAQGYSSPSSYRKKAFMFGKWSHKAEDIYQKLLSGDYTYTDLETAFQPLKPFVYTHLEKHIGDGTPIETMNVPFQAKNSEYLLIMADAIMQSEVRKSGELSRPNLLRAVYRVMEDSERLNPTKGIDTVQFESAIKSGLQGKMNIHQFAEKQGGEEAAYTFMMSQIYQNYDPKKPVEEQKALQYNTDTFVHEAPYEDYCLQQEVPEHFKGHQQAHGSQIRMITPSDLDLYKDPNGNPNDESNINYYEWTEPDGTKRKVRADEFKKEYEQTIADNIAESIENLSKELHLDSLDKKERNIALSKILLREILSSPRYGVDLAQACAVDKNTGEFRIPKGDPIQAKRIEQLINSIIKNRVNKQKIAGGPIVQVTNFGTSKQLHIRFKDNSGKILLTEEEFNNKLKGEAVRIVYKDYKEYLQKEQHGIAYFEVFIPIWANEIFEKFANEDGTIDVKAIEAIDPDLLKMISYRIPTEDKYSCAPMKVVGFMPREAGDAIMLPYELTEIDDSDFDVDKRYVMRKDIQIVENKHAIEKLLIQRVSESYAKAHDGKVNKRFITEQVKMYMDNPDRMKTADKLMEAIHREKQVIMKLYKDKVWKTIKPTSGKLYRDNKIVDMTWAVLTNEKTADKILNPGGFDNFKRAGYMAAAYRLHSGEYTWQQLQDMSIDELSDLCYVDKDLTWADTQIQFYKQNAAAASLIGVFAVNKVAHATLEGDDIFLAVDEICGEEPFAIAGTVFSGRMQVDPKYDSEGNLIGKNLGSGVSASADAAKTPVQHYLNINMTTVGIFTSLLRLGMSFNDACNFMGQDVIARVLDEFNRQNLTGYASLNSVIDKEIKRLKEAHNISDDADINKEPLSREELVTGLTPEEHEVIDYKVLIAFQKAKAIAESMRKISFATRFNSISSAVGPLIIDNLIMEHKMEQFMDENVDTHFYTHDDVNVDITDVFADHPVLKQFAETVKIARQMTSDMPAGSTGFRNLLAKLPDDIKEKIYNDKKLFSNLSDFYQSYLAIASGLINPANLKNYIDGFPKWFMKQDFKEKYPDNALIQAIQMTVSKKTGRAFLSIKLTGEDETVKETYRNAWIDLHKSNPELSQQLFEYCFFRAGIGFSPKTFMAVVPTYVKERLQKKLSNGETATYLDTYRRFPSVTEELVIDQFIANNWEDNKLVPKKGGKNSHFTIKGDHLYATVQEDIDDLEGLTYIKTSGKGVTYLWKKVSDDQAGVHYVKMKPLGNNGEYVEMSLSEISTPLTATTQTSENNDASEIKTTSPSETDATEVESKPVTPESKKAIFVANLAKDYMAYNESSFGRKISEAKAKAQANEMAEHPERFGSLMQKILESKGIKVNKDEAIRKLKDLDLC